MLRSGRTPRLRSHREFAEQEITLPKTGPKGGRKFRCEFQPFSALWFAAIDCGLFNRFAATGPSQSGKTLTCHVEPIMYHLFEKRENVIGFAPSMEICEQKWLIDILPTLQLSRFEEFLPRRGGGAKGGFDELIRFGNGTYLKWMTGGGGDKNKSAITAKVACGTEVDGMAEGSSSSVESTPLNQIAARLRSHGSRARMYLECTVSLETGIIWQEIQNGTNSRIVLQCAHCFDWVTPEREHFIGWENAQDEIQAESLGKFYCPECGTAWTPSQRREANAAMKLIHAGQTIGRDGVISGPIPETRTFGFRWSAVNNNFAEESTIGAEEWKAARNPDRDAAEKERCQFVWAIPFKPESNSVDMKETLIASRLSRLPRGIVPNNYETLVLQADLHNRWHYWVLMATSPGNVRTIVDYGITPTPFDDSRSPADAIVAGLERLDKEMDDRQIKTADGRDIRIDLRGADGGYEQDAVLAFATAHPGWWLTKGDKDFKPKKRDQNTLPGEHYYRSRQDAKPESNNAKWWLLINETNHWMRQVHGGFLASTFEDDGVTRRPGSLALFGDDPSIHLARVDRDIGRSAYATQLLAWLWQEVTSPRTGTRMQWVPQYGDGKDDHFFDVTYGCLTLDLLARELKDQATPQTISLGDWFNG